MEKEHFLNTHIFYGLQNLNNGFDNPSIHYFNTGDFDLVLQRVEKLKIGIYGIEPWLNGVFFDVLTCEDYEKAPTDPDWYWNAFNHFKALENALQFSATFYIPLPFQ